MQHEILQHRPFTRTDIQWLTIAQHLVCGRIDRQGAKRQHGCCGRLRAAQQGTQTGQQFRQIERLNHIVVCARVQSLHAILQGITRSQHQHRHGLAALAHALSELHAIHLRQANIDDGCIETVGCHGIDCIFSALNNIHDITGRCQALFDAGGQHLVIFYQ